MNCELSFDLYVWLCGGKCLGSADRDMDSVETYAFGNVRLVDNKKGGGGGGCNIL